MGTGLIIFLWIGAGVIGAFLGETVNKTGAGFFLGTAAKARNMLVLYGFSVFLGYRGQGDFLAAYRVRVEKPKPFPCHM